MATLLTVINSSHSPGPLDKVQPSAFSLIQLSPNPRVVASDKMHLMVKPFRDLLNTKLLMQPYFSCETLMIFAHIEHLDIRVGDAPQVHGGQLHGLYDGDREGLGVKVVF